MRRSRGKGIAKKLLLVVADSLRYDGTGKPISAVGTVTFTTTYALFTGFPVSTAFWPTVDYSWLVPPSGDEKGPHAVGNAILLMDKILKMTRQRAITSKLSKAGVKTVAISMNDSPPVLMTADREVRTLKGSPKWFRQEYIRRRDVPRLAAFEALYALSSLALRRLRATPYSFSSWFARLSIMSDLARKFNVEKAFGVDSSNVLFDHVDTYADALIEGLKRLKGDAFVYLHLLTPHVPYLCSGDESFVAYAVDLARFWLESPKTLSEIKQFYEKKPEERYSFLNTKRMEKYKRAYKSCVKAFYEFLKRLREELTDWEVVATSDHPEYFGEDGFFHHPNVLPREPLPVPLITDAFKDVNNHFELMKSVAEFFGVEVNVWEMGGVEAVPAYTTKETVWGVNYEGNLYYVNDKGEELCVGECDWVEDYLAEASARRRVLLRVLRVRRKLAQK